MVATETSLALEDAMAGPLDVIDRTLAQAGPCTCIPMLAATRFIKPRMAAVVAKPADVKLLRKRLDEEHKAIHDGRQGDAIMLSARFGEGIAEIAGQSILTGIIQSLCSRSALIISLYSRRSDAFCESHAHHALVDAIAKNSEKDASELMTSHLVDLLSGIDVSEAVAPQRKLSEILRGQ